MALMRYSISIQLVFKIGGVTQSQMLNASLEFKEGYVSLNAVDWQEQGKILRQLTVHIWKELDHDPSVYVGATLRQGLAILFYESSAFVILEDRTVLNDEPSY